MALLSVFAIGTLSAGGLSWLLLSRELTQKLADDARAAAESFAEIAASGDRTDLMEQIAAQVRASRDGTSLFAFIDGATGETIGSLHPGQPFEGPRRLVVEHDITPVVAADPVEAYLAYGIRTDLGWVIAAQDEAWVAESGEILMQATIWSLAAALLLSLGLVLVIARRNERRIGIMERVLDAVGASRLDKRIGDGGSDDLARLAARVDRMLGRVEASVEAIRQVSTDVAHDLRAPLARLRVRLEPLALSPDLPAEARHELGSALLDIDAISGTFGAILRLARLQSGDVERRRDPVELALLAREVCEIMAPSAEDAGHSLALDLPPGPAIVMGDLDLLKQALGNLMANAVQHCPPPARITVSVAGRGGRPVLSVADDGPGIPEAERQRVLERFVRLDASRSVPGTGLGLSLVAVIAELHDAEFVLDDNAPGTRASLLFRPNGVPRR